MDPIRQIMDNVLDGPNDANCGDDEFHSTVVRWHHLCVAGLAQASQACSAWLLLAGASVALHSQTVSASSSEKATRRLAILSQLQQNPQACKELLRMCPAAFNGLCEKFRETGEIRPNSEGAITEQLATFLFIIGKKFTNRAVAFFLCRSGQTISKHFHNVVCAVISMEAELLQQPNARVVAPEIASSSRFFPYFKDCIGAVDGTHVRVKVPRVEQARFRGRKEWPTQNVLVCCSFDMRFTYVLAGWEGSPSDSRVLKSALTRDDALQIPRDAGFGLTGQILAPYGRTRYHLNEYSMRGPQNAQELFNLRHASLRNTIERAFGVLKKRFPIISSGAECHYSNLTTTKIILACCIMHNFLLGFDEADSVCIDEGDQNNGYNSGVCTNETLEMRDAATDYACGVALRDEIAAEMWRDYLSQGIPGMDTASPRKAKKAHVASPKHFRWNPQMESVLLELLIRKEAIGNRIGGTFTATAYTNIVRELRRVFETPVQKNHVQNKLKLLKAHYASFKNAFAKMSGFAWNVEILMFEAENEVWEALINDNPAAAALRGKTVSNWDKLDALFLKNIATGSTSYSGRDMHERLNRRLDMDSESSEWQSMFGNSHAQAQNWGDASGYQSFHNTYEEPSSANAPGVQSSSGQRKAKRKVDHVDASELAKASEKLLLGMENMSTAIVTSARELSNNGAMERNQKVFKELQSLQLRKPYMLRCYKYLARNHVAANEFLSVPIEFREDMLVFELGFDNDSPSLP